jgi:hypothetical protein
VKQGQPIRLIETRKQIMTTDGSITNPTAVALARIVYNAEQMFDAACSDTNGRHTRAHLQAERDAYQAILKAVTDIATRNGNDPADILVYSRKILNRNGGLPHYGDGINPVDPATPSGY